MYNQTFLEAKTMAEQKSFLTFPISSIRRSIKDIDDSYRNPWDIFAELTQNAVDAIHRMQKTNDENGKIELKVDAKNRTIEITDNGCGISAKDLPVLLRLFSSGKSGDSSSVGEKGVGLKFAIFQSTYFKIISSDGKSGGWAEIKDARLWKKQTNEEDLKLEFEETKGDARGTKIILKGVEIGDVEDEQSSIFYLSFAQLKHVLRNATYLGDTSSIWDANIKPIAIELFYSDYNGEEYHECLQNKFALPIESVDESNIVDMKEFKNWLQTKDHNDTAKRDKLQGKILVLHDTCKYKDYRKISYWVCFLPSRRDWDEINKRNNLCPSEGCTDEWLQNHSYCLFSPGIYTATKGMPTGISIDTPNTGNAGYWPNFFMIFQDDALTFDIGRKSIHKKTQAIYQGIAKDIFNQITAYVVKYTSAVPATTSSPSSFDKYEIMEGINKLIDLNSSKVLFKKSPAEQEASVAAVFFELIGNGIIKDIEPIYLGYRNKYDLYAYYKSSEKKNRFCIIEFKTHLLNITKDFSEARKVFDEMNYIVCWDVNDTDIQKLSNFGILCEEISKGDLHPLDCPSSVTHKLTIPNCNPLYVIDLKKIV